MTSHRTFALPHAVVLLLVATLLLLVAPAGYARVSGVGLLDFTKKSLKIGDWVRYRVDISTDRGDEEMNYQEVRIVGEDTFRGEQCFWIETWYGSDSTRATYDLSLVSYDLFNDPNADLRTKNHVRLVLSGVDEEGIPELLEVRASTTSKEPDLSSLRGKYDSLGVESVPTVRGAIDARLVQLHRKVRNPRQGPDSTVNMISDVVRRTWVSRKVPLTSLVKEEEVNKQLVQTYAVGQPSTSAPEILIRTLLRTATVVDWGTGAQSRLLALWREHRGFLRLDSGGLDTGLDGPSPR